MGQSKPAVVLWVYHLILAEFFSFKKNQSRFGWSGCLSVLNSFVVWSFFWTFMACDKNCPFHILKGSVFMHYLPDKKLTLISPARNLIDLLRSLSVLPQHQKHCNQQGSPCGIKAKVLDCGLEVSKFRLQSCY